MKKSFRTKYVRNCHKQKDVSSKLYGVAAAATAATDFYDNYLAITNPRVVLEEDANSILNLKFVNVDHAFWKEKK